MVPFHVLLIVVAPMVQTSRAVPRALEELGQRLVDGSFGYSIRPPGGWHLDRRLALEGRETTILRMMEPTGRAADRQFRLTHKEVGRAMPMGRMLRQIRGELELEHPSIEIESQQVQPIAGRRGAFLSGRYVAEGVRLLRLEAIVEIAPTSYLVLTCDSPVSIRDRMEPLFHHVTASLEILADPSSEKAMMRALEDGAARLALLTPMEMKKALSSRLYYQFASKGRPIGMVRITERIRRRNKREGLEIDEESWIFEERGIVRRIQSRMFVSLDLAHERWKSSVTRWVPMEGNRPEQLDNAFEEGVRERDVLATSQAQTLHQPLKENQPIQVPKSYLSRGLVRLLPRLIGEPDRSRRIGFLTFDADRAGLIVRVFEFKGACDPPSGLTVSTGNVFCIEEREGLAEAQSTYVVDEFGAILMMKTGDLIMLPAEAADLERRFAQRIREADAAMARLERSYRQSEARFLRDRTGR